MKRRECCDPEPDPAAPGSKVAKVEETAPVEKRLVFKAIKWDVQDTDDNLNVFIHGLTPDNKKVAVKVPTFEPYIYLELDPRVDWDKKYNRDEFDNHFKRKLKNCTANVRDPETGTYGKKELVNACYTKRLYITKKVKAYYYKPAKFFRLHFKNLETLTHFCGLVTQNLKTRSKDGDTSSRVKPRPYSIGMIRTDLKFMVHEIDAAKLPILQLLTQTRTSPAGWISVPYDPSQPGELFAKENIIGVNCADYSKIRSEELSATIDPHICSYDIESTSGDASGNTFTDARNERDEIICISATISRHNQPESEWERRCFVNAAHDKPSPLNVGDSSTIVNFPSERRLLLGWRDYLNSLDPDIIVSYNGLSFDDKYMIIRAGKLGILKEFLAQGRLLDMNARVASAKWSSSAYKDQEFKYMDVPGRFHLDMFPFISKTFTTLPGYRLEDVSSYFLGEHKVDLPAREMIQIHHRGSLDDIQRIVYYCNQDTLLPLKLLQKLVAFIGLSEKANVVKVTLGDLLTRGQQHCVYSLEYYFCHDKDIVINAQWSDYDPPDVEKKFVGATVQNPKVGLHKRIATFDFASLYPTTIIAYNLCFSTFIEEHLPDPPDPETFWKFEWEDHYGCEHDTGIRKTKVEKKKVICSKAEGMKPHCYRFWKREVKQGIMPQILVFLLDARAKTREELAALKGRMKSMPPGDEYDSAKLYCTVLDKRQEGFKVSANSMYGGLGSDFSKTPFYPAAASTTYNGRRSIQRAIEVAQEYRPDADIVYGDTDSAMIGFSDVKTIEEMFRVSRELQQIYKKHFPAPMDFQLEKIYIVYFLLSKKRYVGRIVDETGKVLSTDKKGVIAKRRDNFSLVRDVWTQSADMIMDDAKKWQIYKVLADNFDKLMNGEIDYRQFIITMSLGSDYAKPETLAHWNVAEKMKANGKYVTAGTRIAYLYVLRDDPKAKKYQQAEDPDFYLEHQDTMSINYLTYLEKFVKPMDEVLAVRFGVTDVVKTLFKLMEKKRTSVREYFEPKFQVE